MTERLVSFPEQVDFLERQLFGFLKGQPYCRKCDKNIECAEDKVKSPTDFTQRLLLVRNFPKSMTIALTNGDT